MQNWNPRVGRCREKLGLLETHRKHELPTSRRRYSLPPFPLPLRKEKSAFPLKLPASLQALWRWGNTAGQLIPSAATPGLTSDPALDRALLGHQHHQCGRRSSSMGQWLELGTSHSSATLPLLQVRRDLTSRCMIP